MMGGNGFWFGMHFVWWMFWVIVIVAAVYVLLRPQTRTGSAPRESPHELLRRRYAAGELSTREYEERKAVLDRDAGAAKPQDTRT